MQYNILFIDDESGVLEALEWTFADEPYGCLTCKTPVEALRLMEEIDFAVVVSDQRMPEMDGTELLEKIKHQWPATIRILMTAYQEMDIVLDAINKGHVYNLIFKPWDEMELKRVIKTAVDDYKLRNTSDGSQQLKSETNQLVPLNHRLELKNQYLMERLQQAQKMEALGNLAGGIAHDFNNILMAVNVNAELAVLNLPKESPVSDRLEQILSAGMRAKDLVNQIFTFSRNAEIETGLIQVSSIVEETLKLFRSSLPANITVQQDIQSGALVSADATHIHQVVMNLLTNASHAMSDTGGVLGISLFEVQINEDDLDLKAHLIPGRFVTLTVCDTGQGIPSEVQNKILDPFFTTKKRGEGTGLGLSVTHGIVKQYGGVIDFDSESGSGSTFHVYLPIVTGDGSSAASRE